MGLMRNMKMNSLREMKILVLLPEQNEDPSSISILLMQMLEIKMPPIIMTATHHRLISTSIAYHHKQNEVTFKKFSHNKFFQFTKTHLIQFHRLRC